MARTSCSVNGTAELVRRGETENEQLFGPFFVGLVACYFFWGIQITQSYYYYKTYRRTDGRWTKGAVGLIFIMDAAQSICISEGSWRYMVAEWGESAEFVNIYTWGVNLLPFMDAITTFFVHGFYAQKIWILLKFPHKYIWTGMVIFFSVMQLSAGIGTTAFLVSIHSTLSTVHRAKTWVCIWLITAAVTDVIIMVVMFARLSRSRTGFKNTDDLITKLIRFIVETGAMTAIVQIVDVVFLLRWPEHPYHAVPAFILPKLYSNSILALLNSRNAPEQQNRVTKLWDSREHHALETIGTGAAIKFQSPENITVTSEHEVLDISSSSSRRNLL